MKELEKTYNPADIEDRLYQKWLDGKYFHAQVNRDKKPFTIVMPPPNITGQLHMGHALSLIHISLLLKIGKGEYGVVSYYITTCFLLCQTIPDRWRAHPGSGADRSAKKTCGCRPVKRLL